MSFRLFLLSVALLISSVAFSQSERVFEIGIDRDNNTATGCTWTLHDDSEVDGVELILETTVERVDGQATVTRVALRQCNSQGTDFLGPYTLSSASWPIGSDAGLNVTDVVESILPVGYLGATGTVAIAVQSRSAKDTDVMFQQSIVYNLPQMVPTLGQWGMVAFVIILMAIAVWFMHRNRKTGRGALIGMLVFSAFLLVAFRAGFVPDGNVDDWEGMLPLASDERGDTSDRQIDIVHVFVGMDDGFLFFRIDVDDLDNADPTADDQGITILEDQPVVISLSATDDDDDAFTFAIVTDPTNGVLSGDLPNITYTPNSDYNGSDSFSFSATDDDDATGEGTINLTITPVNDAPGFTPGDNVSLNKDLGPQVIAWATDISPGPADESGQAVTFAVTNVDNAALFSVQPAIAADGTLTFTTQTDVSGTAMVTIELSDDGGTANGGDDTSDSHTFSISVGSVNDPPSFTAGGDQTVDEDSGAQTAAAWATGMSPGPADESGQTLTFNVSNDNNALFSVQPDVDETTGDLTYTPAADANGSAVVTVTLSDDGGGSDTSAPQTFTINVTALNDPPDFVKGSDQVVAEDAGAQSIPSWATGLSPGPIDENGQSVIYDISNDNNALFSAQPSVDASGVLSYTPADDANGSAVVTIRAVDDGGTGNGGNDTSPDQTFNITVTGINDPPTFTALGNQSAAEDSGAQTVPNWASSIAPGPADESGQIVSFLVSNDNNALFSVQPALDATGTLTYTPAPMESGSATVTVTASDDGGTADGGDDTADDVTFTISIDAVNDAPTFTIGATQTVNEDSGAQVETGWIADGNTVEMGQTISYEVTNDNNALFSVQPAVDTDGNLTYTPADDAVGSATLTVTAMDDGGTANGGNDTSDPQMTTITVDPVNDAPSFTKGTDQTADEEAGLQTANGWATSISTGPSDESGQTVSFNVSNDNNALFSGQPAVDASGNLTYTPAVDATGSATVTVSISDDGGTANGGDDTSDDQTFTITINPVNDAPTFTVGATQTVTEDSGAQTVPTWIADGDTVEAGQTISYSVTNDNNALFSVQPAVDASGQLTYTPAANANGSATLTVTAMDDGGTANGGVDTSASQTATVTVTAVNDEPSFTKGADDTVAEDAGLQTLNGWATSISTGPTDENGQTPSFNVSNDNNALFSVQPAVDVSGNLTYTPAADANGSATVTVSVSDDGGTADGGDDTSPDQTFTITVNAVNDAPSFTNAGNVSSTGEGAKTESNWATAISAGPADESGQVLTFNVIGNTDNSLFDVQPAVNATTGDLTFTVAMGAIGTSTITVNLSDDGGGDDTSANVVFDITVAALNMEPSFTAGADQTVDEDSGAASVTGWATAISDGDGDTQTLTFTVTNNNNALFLVQPDVDEATGNLTFTPADDANGSATVSVTLSDDGGTFGGGDDTSPTAMFTITVDSVNDEPSFTKGPDETVLEDAGAQTVMSWVAAADTGPANESGQTLTYSVSNNNNALFSTQPAVSSTGTLTYTPAANANGSATVTISVSDDGGTANGGDDTSPDQTFTITVTAVNDLPTAGADSYSTVGNTHLVVQATTPAFPHFDSNLNGLLNNDSDAVEMTALSIVEVQGNAVMGFPASETTDQGGTVTVNADGSFTYTPAVGFTGSDTFSYLIEDADNGQPAGGAATVTVTVANMVWFVDSDNMGTADGRSHQPFTSLASLQGADPDVAGDIIYIATGTGSYTGGLVMEADQTLTGEGAAFTLTDPNNAMHTFTLPAGTAPDITNAAGDVITMADGVTVEGVNLLPTASAGIAATTIDGGTVTNVTIDPAATSDGVDLQNCLGTWTLSNITVNSTPGSSGFGLNLTGSTGGTFTVSGLTVTDMANGITIGANTGALSFTGTTTITETDSAGILLNGDNGGITFATLNMTPAAGIGINASNSTGAFNVSGGTITHTGGRFGDFDSMTGGGDLSGWTVADGQTGLEVTNSDGTWVFPNLTLDLSMVRRGVSTPAPVLLNTNPTADFSFGTLNLTNNAGSALDIANSGTVSWNAASVVSGGNAGAGSSTVLINNTAFEAPGQTLATLTNTIGGVGLNVQNTTGNLAVGNIMTNISGISINLLGNAGTFTFEAVNITSSSADAFVANSGSVNIDTNVNDTVNITSGEIAVNLSNVSGTMFFGAVTSTGSSSDGIRLTSTSAGLSFNGLTDINSASDQAIDINGVSGPVTFSNLDVDGATEGVLLTNNTNRVTVTAGDVAGTTSAAVHVNGGAIGIDFGASITNTAGRALLVENRTGGNSGHQATFSGAVTDTTAQGILIQNNNSGNPQIDVSGTVTITNATNAGVTVNNNAGASVNFGTVNITNSTSNQIGFAASNNGTGSGVVSSTSGTIHGGTAAAVDIDNTLLGLTFTSVTSIGGASAGIDLNTTTGTFTVTGSGGGTNDATGGTIQSKTGSGISLTSAAGVSLGYMLIDQNGGDGITGSLVNGLAINRTDITDNGDAVNEAGIDILNLLGTNTITNTLVSGSAEHNIEIVMNGANALTLLTVDNATIRDNSMGLGADGFQFEAQSTATANVVIQNSLLSGNLSDGIQVGAIDNSVVDLVLNNNTIQNSNIGAILAVAGNADMTFDITNHPDISNIAPSGGNAAIHIGSTTTSTSLSSISGTINNNTIDNSGSGIRFDLRGDAVSTVAVTNNTMTNITRFGVDVLTGDLAGDAVDLDLTVTGNSATTGRDSFYFETLEATSICLDVRNNTGNPINGDDAFVIFDNSGNITLEQNNDCGGVCANASTQIAATNTGAPVTTDPVTLVASGTCGTPP